MPLFGLEKRASVPLVSFSESLKVGHGANGGPWIALRCTSEGRSHLTIKVN
ncbi:hypothetical protein Scep_020141 [Stephania cephalantha]|uniref:Uncharacterized protein n=1 Tax=Stephania cephalantha TaxID=152367 RepID=A0AAP0ICM0_9MAGN